MSKLKIQFKPTWRQYEALEKLSDSTTSEVLYWGGARWGKSYFGCAWIIMQCLSKSGSAWIIWRNELKRLRQTTLLTFFEVAKSFGVEEQFNYNAQESTITFKNGSRVFLIDLSHMPSDPNYDRLGSYGITGVFIDEAQEIDVKAINILKGRFSLLEWEGWSTTPKALYTCNPAKNWIYTEFYQPHKRWTLESRRVFVPSLVTDNPFISKHYIEQLKTADKVTVERLLNGNFEYDDTPGKLYKYDALIDMFTNQAYNWTKYITCDAARHGKDLAVIQVWDWWEVVDIISIEKCWIDDLAKRIRELAFKHWVRMSHTIVDEDGVGWGAVDILKCKWFLNNSTPISPYESKVHDYMKRNYVNLKTQCYFELVKPIEEWIIRINTDDEGIKQKIIEELDIVCEVDIDKDAKKKIISKEKIKERLGRSPDYSDALMMRMYFELKDKHEYPDDPVYHNEPEDWAYTIYSSEEDTFEIEIADPEDAY